MSSIAKLWAGQTGRRTATRRLGGRLGGVLALALLNASCDPAVPTDRSAPTSTACDLNRERCTTATRWGNLNLELSPRPLPVLNPIAIEVRFDRANPTRIHAQLDGVEMEMGPNLATLQRVDGQTLRGQVIIPICLTGTMKWRLRLVIGDGPQEQTADFVFEAPSRPGNVAAAHRH